MDGGGAQSAASRRLVHLGRRVGLLSRTVPPRRHPQRLPVQLVSAPGGQHAARRRRARGEKRRDRRTWSPYPAGGPTDETARMVAQSPTTRLKQTVMVEGI